MIGIYITAIICATITILSLMYYDIERRRIAASDRRTKTRTVEKEVVIEVPVFKRYEEGPAEDPKETKAKGTIKGGYVDKDGNFHEVTGRTEADE